MTATFDASASLFRFSTPPQSTLRLLPGPPKGDSPQVVTRLDGLEARMTGRAPPGLVSLPVRMET